MAWKFNPTTNCFEPAASLTGYTSAVVTMFVGANRLYSGSMDHTIRVSYFMMLILVIYVFVFFSVFLCFTLLLVDVNVYSYSPAVCLFLCFAGLES